MKVIEAISHAAEVCSEIAADGRAYDWLSELECKIRNEVLNEDFEGIGVGQDGFELCAPVQYEKVYVLYLIMKMNFFNSEHSKFISCKSEFSSAYAELVSYYMRKGRAKEVNYYRFL